MSNRITITDVARHAGVSLMTVSRVINNKAGVSESTRQRVQKSIQELEYRPSRIARSLATQQSRSIALVVPDIANPFFSDIAHGVEELAYDEGYSVFLGNTGEDPQREYKVLLSLEEKQVDGLILCSSRLDDQLLVQLLELYPAAVLVNRPSPEVKNAKVIQTVLIDDFQGGRIATRYLLDLNLKMIAFLAGPTTSFSSRGRKHGYLDTMETAGIQVPSHFIRNCEPTVEGGKQAAKHLLKDYPDLEAVICFNDLVAIGLLHACSDAHVRVPDDLAVIGYDNTPLASLVTPTITTCRVPRHQLGAQAMKLLLEQINGCPSGCEKVVFTPELIVRASTP